MNTTSIAFNLLLPNNFPLKAIFCPSLCTSLIETTDSALQTLVGLVALIGPFGLSYQLISIAFFELMSAFLMPIQAGNCFRLLTLRSLNGYAVLFAMLNVYLLHTLIVAFLCGLVVFQNNFNEAIEFMPKSMIKT